MRFLLTFIALSFLSQAKTQEFTPIGATWTYETYNWSPPNYSGSLMCSVEKDTTINNILCKKIIGPGLLCSIRPKQEFLYKKNDSVFFWDEYFNEFQLLYDINAQEGESWTIEIPDIYSSVDSVVFETISNEVKTYNSRDFRILNVEYTFKGINVNQKVSTSIFEGISEIGLLLSIGEEVGFQSLCDGERLNGFRCYSEPLGYVFPTADGCLVSTNDISNNETITIYPNPSKDFISIDIQANKLEVINVSGEILLEEENANRVNVESLTQGIYFLKITLQNGDSQFKRFFKN